LDNRSLPALTDEIPVEPFAELQGENFFTINIGGLLMPIAVLFKFAGASSRAKYQNSVRKILKGRRTRLADWPVKGCLTHIAGPVPGGWCVIDVWQSRAAFNRFGKKLRPVLKEIGIKGPKPTIFPVARFIKT
jgi:hypothetical protein